MVSALLGTTVVLGGVAVAATVVPSAQAAVDTHAPQGHVDVLRAAPGGITLKGWAFDPDSPMSALTIYLWTDGKLSGLRADLPRPDVAAAKPGTGTNHGFAATRRLAEGPHNLCLVAANIGLGTNTTLACSTLIVADTPRGRVEKLAVVPGGISVRGWAYDPDSPTTPISVKLSIDATVHALAANTYRPDIATAFPGAGAAHGFGTTLRLAEGQHRVCATAVNISFGVNRTLACATLTVIDSPRGRMELFAQAPGGVRLKGWTFDPNSPTTALTVYVYIDRQLHGIRADRSRLDVAAAFPGAGAAHGFDTTYLLAAGTHSICAVAGNLSYGTGTTLACRTVTLRYTPTTVLTSLTKTATGVRIEGWSLDPDTAAPVSVRVSVDGSPHTQLTASGPGGAHPGHSFGVALTLKSGVHLVCAAGLNLSFGTGTGPPSCMSVTLQLNPFGRVDSLSRAAASPNLAVHGWAIDPDTSWPITITVKVDAGAPVTVAAGTVRTDVGRAYPAYGSVHGYALTLAASEGEHTVCVSAVNVAAGVNTSLGCRVINAVHPVAPSAPRNVHAIASYAGAVLTWAKPTTDGGAPVSTYTVTSSPGGVTVVVPGTLYRATLLGLAGNTQYTFAVVAANIAGRSLLGRSNAVTTPTSIPAQTTPAPISTSRYIRNIRGSTATDLTAMRAEGAADGARNPSGHRYLILLDIGGQDETRAGVVLSATARFVSYADLVRDLNAYVDGYASQQRPNAPVTIAIGTNNDMDVSASSGANWARTIVNPVAVHAAPDSSIKIAGANDIEPGFRGTYTESKAWVVGYLQATSAAFVFNGSADGCAWTVINAGCNNGWTMAGLYYLSAGVAPTRVVNLPQVYNNAMAAQWKYISLTGLATSRPRINFGGALTEYTACAQAGGCASLTGGTAWTQMWTQLQSHPALRIASLPYSTDLRIDS